MQDDEDDIEDVFFEPCDVGQADRLDPAELLAAHWDGELDDDEQQAPGHREAPQVTEFLGLKAPGEGPNSLADIAMTIARIVPDPDASAELSRRSDLDRQDAGPQYEPWAARSGERDARRAQIPFPGLAPPTSGSLSSAERIMLTF